MIAGLDSHVVGQLYSIGIPAERQTIEGLARYFPDEFKIAESGLDLNTVASFLLHLAKQGVVRVPISRTGDFLSQVEPGRHFCQFYRDENHLLELVVPYLAAGLAMNEFCLWMLPASMPKSRARLALKMVMPDLDRRLRGGQLEFHTYKEWYLDQKGRLKPWQDIMAQFVDKQDRALARGFKSVRATGDTGWIANSAELKSFIAYDMHVNASIEKTKIAALCTYRAKGTARELAAVVAAHQDSLYRKEGRWQRMPATPLRQAEEFLLG